MRLKFQAYHLEKTFRISKPRQLLNYRQSIYQVALQRQANNSFKLGLQTCCLREQRQLTKSLAKKLADSTQHQLLFGYSSFVLSWDIINLATSITMNF